MVTLKHSRSQQFQVHQWSGSQQSHLKMRSHNQGRRFGRWHRSSKPYQERSVISDSRLDQL